MKVLNIEQNSEVWQDWRRPNIGGSDEKNIKPLKKGAYKGLVEGAIGFWKLVAGAIAQEKDGEKDTERGHRTEEENLRLTNEKYGINMVKVGVWLSDFSEYVHISPDGGDEGDKPKHAFEGKAFCTEKHLQIMYFDMKAKEQKDYNPLFSLPADNQDQAIKYFNVSETLEVLHWSMINECLNYEELSHYVIDIKREHVAPLIEKQREVELNAIIKRKEVIEYMLKKVKETK